MGNKKESYYKITRDFVEQEILSCGVEYRMREEQFFNPAKFPNEIRPLASITRRMRRLKDYIDALKIIYNDVNLQTKNIIELLYMKGYSFDHVSEKLNITKKTLLRQHHFIVEEVMEVLGAGFTKKTKYENSNRGIKTSTKRDVFNKYNSKCNRCDSKENLHMHHITRFSDGGSNESFNLELLCKNCHAEEHKEEKVYNLIKSLCRSE